MASDTEKLDFLRLFEESGAEPREWPTFGGRPNVSNPIITLRRNCELVI